MSEHVETLIVWGQLNLTAAEKDLAIRLAEAEERFRRRHAGFLGRGGVRATIVAVCIMALSVPGAVMLFPHLRGELISGALVMGVLGVMSASIPFVVWARGDFVTTKRWNQWIEELQWEFPDSPTLKRVLTHLEDVNPERTRFLRSLLRKEL